MSRTGPRTHSNDQGGPCRRRPKAQAPPVPAGNGFGGDVKLRPRKVNPVGRRHRVAFGMSAPPQPTVDVCLLGGTHLEGAGFKAQCPRGLNLRVA
jgi:hypothetical protein